MEGPFAYLGAIVFTTRSIYWVTGLGYISVALANAATAYIVPKSSDFGGADCSE